jgi:hypothetical protein
MERPESQPFQDVGGTNLHGPRRPLEIAEGGLSRWMKGALSLLKEVGRGPTRLITHVIKFRSLLRRCSVRFTNENSIFPSNLHAAVLRGECHDGLMTEKYEI